MTAIARPAAAAMGPVGIGIALFVAAGGWVALSGVAAGAAAGPTVALIFGAGLAVGLCAVVARSRPGVVPAGIVGAAIALGVVYFERTLRPGPLQGPFGYANATAAFFVQALVAAMMLAVETRSKILRTGAVVAAIGFGSIVVASRSWTGVLMLPVVVLVAVLVVRIFGGRAAVATVAGVFLGVFIVTVGLGALDPGGRLGSVIGATVSEERVALWHDALSITADEPLLGVGPGRFAAVSPIASSDEDLRWAHHEFLQVGAESGVPGSLLAVAIFLWGFAALWLSPPSRTVVLAASGLALLGIHACVDYVLHFPAVALAGAAVLAAGLGTAWHDGAPQIDGVGGPA